MKFSWQIAKEPFKHNTEILLCSDPIMPYGLCMALSPCQSLWCSFFDTAGAVAEGELFDHQHEFFRSLLHAQTLKKQNEMVAHMNTRQQYPLPWES